MITYKVREFYTTFQEDVEPVSITTTFDSEDVFKSKELAEHFYIKKLKGIQSGSFKGLPFASPDQFELGKNSVASVDFTILINGDEVQEFYLSDNDGESKMDGLRIEAGELIKDSSLLNQMKSYELFGLTSEGVKLLLNGGVELSDSEIEDIELWECRVKMLMHKYMYEDFLPTIL